MPIYLLQKEKKWTPDGLDVVLPIAQKVELIPPWLLHNALVMELLHCWSSISLVIPPLLLYSVGTAWKDID